MSSVLGRPHERILQQRMSHQIVSQMGRISAPLTVASHATDGRISRSAACRRRPVSAENTVNLNWEKRVVWFKAWRAFLAQLGLQGQCDTGPDSSRAGMLLTTAPIRDPTRRPNFHRPPSARVVNFPYAFC